MNMTLDNETWLTEFGDDVIENKAERGFDALTDLSLAGIKYIRVCGICALSPETNYVSGNQIFIEAKTAFLNHVVEQPGSFGVDARITAVGRLGRVLFIGTD